MPAWTFESNQSEAVVSAVGTAGDVNNDGYDDIIVTSRLYDAGQTDEGRAWVFLGQEGGVSQVPAAVLEIDVAGGGTVSRCTSLRRPFAPCQNQPCAKWWPSPNWRRS